MCSGAGLVDVGYSIKLKKFKFAGHVFRGSNERWVKRTTVWTPYGCKRGKGRPATRWEDEMKNRVRSAWGRETWNRVIWRRIGEAYAQE